MVDVVLVGSLDIRQGIFCLTVRYWSPGMATIVRPRLICPYPGAPALADDDWKYEVRTPM
jgi:hypothetical protein